MRICQWPNWCSEYGGGVSSDAKIQVKLASGENAGEVELSQDEIGFLKKEYKGKSGNEALLLNGPLLYKILKELDQKVIVTDAQQKVTPGLCTHTVSYISHDIIVNYNDDDPLFFQLIRAEKQCELYVNPMRSTDSNLVFHFDCNTINTQLIDPKILDVTNKDFYGQQVQLLKHDHVTDNPQIRVGLIKYKYFKYGFSLPMTGKTDQYSVFEILYWVSKICELTYKEREIQFPSDPEEDTSENRVKFQNDILPFLVANLSCLNPCPGVIF